MMNPEEDDVTNMLESIDSGARDADCHCWRSDDRRPHGSRSSRREGGNLSTGISHGQLRRIDVATHCFGGTFPRQVSGQRDR